MLGVLIKLVVVGDMFHKHTSGLQITAMRNDLALAGHISVSLQGGGAVSWSK